MTSLAKLSRCLDAPTATSLNILPPKREWTGGNKWSSSNLVVFYKLKEFLQDRLKLLVNITFQGLTTYLTYEQYL